MILFWYVGFLKKEIVFILVIKVYMKVFFYLDWLWEMRFLGIMV